MSINNMERNLLHRIFLLLLITSITYKFSKHWNSLDLKNTKSTDLLTIFSGSRLQPMFNSNIGYGTPKTTSSSIKTRTLILIILAISGDVSSNPGLHQHDRNTNNGKAYTLGVRPNLPDWIKKLSNSSKHGLLWEKNLHEKMCKRKSTSNISRSIKATT